MPPKKTTTPAGFVAFPTAPKQQQQILLVTKDEFDKHTEALAGQKKLLDWTFGFMIAVLVICVIGYFTFLFDSMKLHYEIEDKFTDELNAAHEKVLDVRLTAITSRIDSISSHPKTDTQLYLPMQVPSPTVRRSRERVAFATLLPD